jgi:glycosyltransferase involved in cell wall biosynthesis
MKVSILIPTYNRIDYLRRSLGSARNQTHTDLEILVSDNGSTDGSQDYVRSVAESDPRVRLLPKNPNPGMFNNFNHLLSHSTGEAFAFLCDDDMYAPTFVEELIKPMVSDPKVHITFSDHWIVDSTDAIQQEASDRSSIRFGRDLLPSGPLQDPIASVVRGSLCIVFTLHRSAQCRAARFDPSLGGAADLDFQLRMVERGTVYYLPQRLGLYRAHATSASSTQTRFMYDGIVAAYSNHPMKSPVHEAMRIERIQITHRRMAAWACSRDRALYHEAIAAYQRCGGNPLHPEALGARLLGSIPESWSKRLAAALRSVRTLRR